jgi:sugar phosphate isomerase/epimerase
MDVKKSVIWACASSPFRDRIAREKTMALAGFLEIARQAGVGAVELHTDTLPVGDAAALSALREDLRSRGMTCPMVSADTDLCTDEAGAAAEMARARQAVAAAGILGARWLRVLAGPGRDGLERAEGIARVVPRLQELAHFASGAGVGVVLENVSGAPGWNAAHFAMSGPVFIAVAERVSKEGVSILFNTATLLGTRDGGAWLLRRVLPSLAALRLIDRAARGSEKPVELGHGRLKLADLFRHLQKHQWRGILLVDYAGPPSPAPLRRCAAYARQVWDAVEP